MRQNKNQNKVTSVFIYSSCNVCEYVLGHLCILWDVKYIMWPALFHSAVVASTFAFRLPLSIIPACIKMGRVVHIVVGIHKVTLINFSARNIFELANIYVIFFKSLLYLTGVTAAELRRYLLNILVIFNRFGLFWQWLKVGKLTEWRKLVQWPLTQLSCLQASSCLSRYDQRFWLFMRNAACHGPVFYQ